ncbi:MAG: GGDEF domain-containing protein [Actinomyces sp.]|nr:MAG: GGDEF domain-containing protein [Actinomyces sp.]
MRRRPTRRVAGGDRFGRPDAQRASRAALARALSATRAVLALVAALAAVTAPRWRDPLAPDLVALTVAIAALVVGREALRWIAGTPDRPDPPMIVVDAGLGLALLVVVGDVAGPVGWVAMTLPVLEALAVSGPLAAVFTWMAIGGSFVAVSVIAGAAPDAVIGALVRHLGGSTLVAVPAWAAGSVLGRELDRVEESRRRAANRSAAAQHLADSAARLARAADVDAVLGELLELAVEVGFVAADIVVERRPAPLVERCRGRLEHGPPPPDALTVAGDEVATTDDSHVQILHLAGLRSGLAVGVEREGGTRRILRVWRDREGPAGVDDAALVATLAAQARGALSAARRRAALEQRAAALAFEATHDPLTGVLNRAGLFELLERRLDDLRGRAAVLFVDLDGFKGVNDEYGHDAGDAVLIAVAERLTRRIGGATVARIGGDEFVVVVGVPTLEDARSVGERVVAAVREPVAAVPAARLGASVGVCPIGPDDTVDTVLQRADHAMYVAKRDGGRNVVTAAP